MTIEEILASLTSVEIDEKKIAAFSRERQHYGVAFDLFKETMGYVCILASANVGSKATWSVEQAVLGGHLVRMFKLMHFVLEESAEDRADLLLILTRLLTECIINLRYLLRKRDKELIDSYLAYSLQHEKELADLIRSNIKSRDGTEFPIEKRMLNSIRRTFENSRFLEESVPTKKIKNWGGKNLREKADAVGLGNAYLAIFGGPSRNVHGGWQDLLQYHLECVSPGEFKPNLEFSRPRPQPIFSLTHLISGTLLEYAASFEHKALAPLILRLEDLQARNQMASDLHEQFLVARKVG